jgi:hypothetical protein
VCILEGDESRWACCRRERRDGDGALSVNGPLYAFRGLTIRTTAVFGPTSDGAQAVTVQAVINGTVTIGGNTMTFSNETLSWSSTGS